MGDWSETASFLIMGRLVQSSLATVLALSAIAQAQVGDESVRQHVQWDASRASSTGQWTRMSWPTGDAMTQIMYDCNN